MAALVIRLPRPQTMPGHRRMSISAGPLRSSRLKVTVPYAPVEGTQTGNAPQYAEVKRPGLPSLVLRSNESLYRQSFDLILAHPDPQNTSCNRVYTTLRSIAQDPKPTYITNGPGSSFPWRITEMSARITARQLGTNLATRMIVSISMTQAIDAPPAPRVRYPTRRR